jgi:hypothetical protein
VAAAVLLIGPTVLAFFSGGYFPGPQAWAGLLAWALVIVGMVASPSALPRGRSTWLALGGLGLFACWTLLSTIWAPVAGSAYHAGQLAFVYLGAVLAAAFLLGGRRAQRAVEPALLAGTVVVIGYGASERLLPGLLQFARSATSGGRLEQPLTYWNAMGELAAIGLVLSARVAGDAARPIGLRAAAAAAGAPLGLGLYLSFSRGALFAFAAGLIALIVLAPRREQLRAIVVILVAGAVSSALAAPFRGVTSLEGALSTRESQGAITLAAVIAVAGLAAAAWWLLARRERSAELTLPRRAPILGFAAICCGLALAIVVGAKETSGAASLGNGAGRLTSLSSNRYAYWGVALRAFESEPVRGVGAGGWAVEWLRYRPIRSYAQDAHSLPLQTIAELGLVGLAVLAVFLAGVGLSATRAHRTEPALSAGPSAAFVAWLAHQPLDWDWQLPAVTLLAMIAAGMLIAAGADPPIGSETHVGPARDALDERPVGQGDGVSRLVPGNKLAQ